MYLAVIRTNLDELPVFLANSRKRAVAAIAACTVDSVNNAAKLMGVDYAGIVTGAVIRFKSGVPIKLELVPCPHLIEGES